MKLSQTILDIINLGSACELASGGSADETSIYNDGSTSPPCQKKERQSNRSKKRRRELSTHPKSSCALLFEFLPPKAPKLFPRFAEVKAGGVDGRVATDSANYETSQTLVLVCLEFGNAVNH